ncbi:hypothetical protein KO493_01170 [Tamlana agarivorans]|uniref:Uncharacterized protein n=1 Tax=Pseudotamlana agarivorans TaxID=481183 RepID=A0ACC5U4Q5_9FLAO|nr:hypothetical protein [Tamlana agarivorans]MBU2949307.1 hypothetical protein [Tamlana agarivorans]
MKNLSFWKYALLGLSMVMLFSCDTDDDNNSDVNVYFVDSALNMVEGDTEATNIPIQVFTKGDLQDNLQITYTIEGDGADRVSDESGGVITFEKGYESYRGYITLLTLNNDDGDGDAELSISLSSSNPNIIFGLGPDNDNNTLVVTVIDDECTNQTDVFEGTLINNATYGSETSITATLSGDVLTINGDFIGYSALSDATVGITLTPSSPGASDGIVVLNAGEVGTDSDGYDYYLAPNGEGTYDACIGYIEFSFYVYYGSPGSWSYWYGSSNVITIP